MSDQENGREGYHTPAAQPNTSTASVLPSVRAGSDEPSAATGDDRAGSYPSTEQSPIDAPAGYSALPLLIFAAMRWLLWYFEFDLRDPTKKPRKVPAYLNGRNRYGALDTPEDSAQLCRFGDAYFALLTSEKYEGLAIAAGPDGSGNYVQALDFDNVPDEHLQSFMAKLPGYVELSPSGRGVRVLGYGRHFKTLGANGSGVEAYCEKRFVTVTGWQARGQLADLADFVEQVLVPRHAEKASKPPDSNGVNGATMTISPQEVTDLRSALFAMRSDEYELWIRMGLALKTLGETGRGLWLAWSATSAMFDAREASKKWEGFAPNDIGHKSVFIEAQQRGWLNPNSNEARAAQRAEQWERIKKVGDGTLAPTPMPVLTADDMVEQLVFIRARSFVAFLDRPTANAPLSDMRNDFAASFTEVEEENEKGEKKLVRRPSIELWLKRANRLRADTLTFDPRYGDFCTDPDGAFALNLWRPRSHLAPPDWQERAKPFVEHVEFLIPNQSERERFLSWLAHIEQHPGVLPHSGYLMVAPKQGVGRNWTAAVLAYVWKGHVALDFDLNQTLSNGFNGRLSRRLLAVIDEANDGHQGTATRNSEKFKSMVTATERHINPKYGSEHVEHNCCRWLIFSNYVSAIPIGDNDRRWNVIRNGDPRQDEAYYVKLYGLLDDPQFIASVRHWFRERDLTDFNPGARPVMNEAKLAVIDSVRSEADDRAKEVVRTWPRDVITGTELAQQLYDQDRQDGRLKYRAEQAGMLRWKGNGGGRVRLDGWRNGTVTVWIVRHPERWAQASSDAVIAELRRYEA